MRLSPVPKHATPISAEAEPAPVAEESMAHTTRLVWRDRGRTSDPDEHLAGAFFSQPTSDGSVDGSDAWDDSQLPVMAHGARRAMYATLAILAVSAILLSGYVAYARLIMPVPVELGRGSGMPPHLAIGAPTSAPSASATVLPPPTPNRATIVPAAVNPAFAPPGSAPSPVAAVPAAVNAAPVVPAAAPPPNTEVAPAGDVLVEAPTPAAAAQTEPVPRSAPAPSDPALTGMLASASALYEHGQRKQALAAYEQVLERNPNASEALSKIAYIQLDAAHNRRAREFALRAVEADPQSSEGWIVLGAAREALGDRSGARVAYRTCAALSGPYATECRRLGR